MLILKRNPEARYSESYNVLFEGRHVGRIYKAVSHAPREAPWFWGLDFFEWQGSDGPQYGNAANREAAMKAFRAAWDRRPEASDARGYFKTEISNVTGNNQPAIANIRSAIRQPLAQALPPSFEGAGNPACLG